MPNAEYMKRLQDLERAVLSPRGTLEATTRKAIVERACSRAFGESALAALEPWLEALVDGVVDKPIDVDIDGVLKLGKTEEELFEVVTSAAVGTALARAKAAFKALGYEK